MNKELKRYFKKVNELRFSKENGLLSDKYIIVPCTEMEYLELLEPEKIKSYISDYKEPSLNLKQLSNTSTEGAELEVFYIDSGDSRNSLFAVIKGQNHCSVISKRYLDMVTNDKPRAYKYKSNTRVGGVRIENKDGEFVGFIMPVRLTDKLYEKIESLVDAAGK